MESKWRIICHWLLIFFLCTIANAAAPTRQNSYTSGEAILSADVIANEDAIFNYLQGGVDTIKDASIVNADIANGANIQAEKLNLQAISQNIANTGTLTNTGNVTITGTLDVSEATAITGVLTVSAGTFTGLTTLESNLLTLPEVTAQYTGASEGAIYTKDTSGQPELFFREESNGDEVQITTAGALVLTSVTLAAIEDYEGGTSTSTSRNQSGLMIAYGRAVLGASPDTHIISSLPFTTAFTVVGSKGSSIDSTSDFSIVQDSATQFTITNHVASGYTVNWIAIGY